MTLAHYELGPTYLAIYRDSRLRPRIPCRSTDQKLRMNQSHIYFTGELSFNCELMSELDFASEYSRIYIIRCGFINNVNRLSKL
jgi:hypothetical protein